MDPETEESNSNDEDPAKDLKETPINGANNENVIALNGFRVKNVSEINSSVATPPPANDTNENINKRKFSAPSIEEDAKEETDALLRLEKGEENSTNDKHDEKKRKMENVNQIKTDISTTANTIENSIPTTSTQVPIKVEVNEVEIKPEPETDTDSGREQTQNGAIIKEENDVDASCSTVSINNSNTNAVNMNVEITDASSTTRESCRYGIRCFRQNPAHRREEAHPGDADYRRPTYPAPPPGTPNCVFGNRCYRRNPVHFQEFAHPEDTNFEENYKNYRLRQRQQQQLRRINSDDIDSDDEVDDPFLDDYDGSEDYVPSEESENDDDEEFVGDYDDCDRAEE